MKKYLPGEDPKAVAHIYGMMGAYAMVDTLKGAGQEPDAAGVLKAARASRTSEPVPAAGPQADDSAKDYFPHGKTYLVRFQHGFWNVLGKPLTRPDAMPKESESPKGLCAMKERFRAALVAAACVPRAGLCGRALAANTGDNRRFAPPMVLTGSNRRPCTSRPADDRSDRRDQHLCADRLHAEHEPGRRHDHRHRRRDGVLADTGLTLPLSGTSSRRTRTPQHAPARRSAPFATSPAVWILNLCVAGQTIQLPLYVNPTVGRSRRSARTADDLPAAAGCARRHARPLGPGRAGARREVHGERHLHDAGHSRLSQVGVALHAVQPRQGHRECRRHVRGSLDRRAPGRLVTLAKYNKQEDQT